MTKRLRVAFLAGLGLLLVFWTLAYRYWQYARPEGSGPAGPAVAREPFQDVWTDQSVLLLGVGDSVTAGFGARLGHSYFDLLARNPDDEFDDMKGLCLSAVMRNLQVSNIAVSGSTSLRHLEILENDLAIQNPTLRGLVVMTSGGNDLIHDYGRRPPREGAMYGATLEQAGPWIENFRIRLERMLDLLDEKFPGGCDIFLADIYDPSDGVGDAATAGLPRWDDGLEILAQYNRIIRDAASRRANVHLVPMYKTFLGHGIHCTNWWRGVYCREDPHYWYGMNLEDPNERGYDAAAVFLIEIAKVADRFRDPTDLEPAGHSATHSAGQGEPLR